MLIKLGNDYIDPSAVSLIRKIKPTSSKRYEGGDITANYVAHLNPSKIVINEEKMSPCIFITKEEAEMLEQAARY